MARRILAMLVSSAVCSFAISSTPYNASFSKSQTYMASIAYCDSKNILAWNCQQCAQVCFRSPTCLMSVSLFNALLAMNRVFYFYQVPGVKSAIPVDATLRGGSLQGYVAKMDDQGSLLDILDVRVLLLAQSLVCVISL
jgi:hypothetical protein